MKIGGHDLSQYIRLLAPLFALIAAVWALRLVLDAAGAPSGLVRSCSVNAAVAVSVPIATLLIHFRRFGSYLSVVVTAFLLAGWKELLIVAAMTFTALSGIRTVYDAAEFSRHMTFSHHVIAHLTFGLGFGELFGAATGCLLLWLLRRLAPPTG